MNALKIKAFEENGKKYYLYMGKKIPAEFKWYIVLNELIRRGYKLKIYYSDGDIRDKPTKWSQDAKTGDIAPVKPVRWKVLKQEVKEVRDNLSDIFGTRTEITTRQLLDVVDSRGLDPEPSETLAMMGMVI